MPIHEINKYEQQRSKNKKFTIMYDSLCYIMRKQTKKKTNFQFKKSFLFMNNKFSTNTIIVPKIKSQKSIFQSPSNETAIHVVTVTPFSLIIFVANLLCYPISVAIFLCFGHQLFHNLCLQKHKLVLLNRNHIVEATVLS